MKLKCGLEVHGYLDLENNKKLFCNCEISHNAEPNTNICPICTGQPGSKPMKPNKEAIQKGIAISEMLNCNTNKTLKFQRKHYDWPDMPVGFQKTISGNDTKPVGEKGNFLGIGITQVHVEEDPAKWNPKTGHVDYNRSGLPLIEIVTEPDFESKEQVREWLKKLLITLKYVKAIDVEAGIKSDVNISTEPNFERVEIKNVNSLKNITNSIEYEAQRQQKEKKQGKEQEQHTRRWNDEKQKTEYMRSKEKAADYRFIPDPDILQMNLQTETIKQIQKQLPEKPHEKLQKYIKTGIDKINAEIISSDIYIANLFEKLITKTNPQLTAKWVRGQLLSVMNYNEIESQNLKISAENLISLLQKIEENKITDEVARKILRLLVEKELDVDQYIKENNLEMVSNTEEIEKYCKEAMQENQKAIEDYKGGDEKALNYLVGVVMRKTKGKAKPQETNKILRKLIK